MGRTSLIIAMFGMAACSGDKSEDSGDFVDPGNPCTVEVSSTVAPVMTALAGSSTWPSRVRFPWAKASAPPTVKHKIDAQIRNRGYIEQLP